MDKIKRIIKNLIDQNERKNLIAYTETKIEVINNLDYEQINFDKSGQAIIKLKITKLTK